MCRPDFIGAHGLGANTDENRTPGDAYIILFTGTGASPGDLAALRRILNNEHLRYSTADSRQLNRMNESQLRKYRLLIVPGGNFEKIDNGLTSSGAANIRAL